MERNLFLFFSVWFVAMTTICIVFMTDLGRVETVEVLKPFFSSSVKGCAESDSGVNVRGLEQNDRGPGFLLSGNQLVYYRAVNHLCCRKAVVRSEVTGSRIDVYEVWSGQGCRCMCFSEIEASIERLAPGRYTVNVYETGTKPGSSEQMEKTTILTKELLIVAR